MSNSAPNRRDDAWVGNNGESPTVETTVTQGGGANYGREERAPWAQAGSPPLAAVPYERDVITSTVQRAPQVVTVPADRVRWGPVWAGLFAALFALLVLWLLGVAIGLTVANTGAVASGGLNPNAGQYSAQGSVPAMTF